MSTTRLRLDELRTLADRCVANPSPTAAQAHELAASLLSLLATFEAAALAQERVESNARTGPAESYREPAQASPFARPARRESDPTAHAELERDLDSCRARLASAYAEIARLRGSPPT